MDTDAAAQKLGYHPEYVRKLVRLGRLVPSGRSAGRGRPLSFTAADLRRFKPGKPGRPKNAH